MMRLKKSIVFICFLLVAIFINTIFPIAVTPALALNAVTDTPSDNTDNVSVVIYFYVTPCKSCEKASQFLETFAEERKSTSELSIIKINYNDSENFSLISKYFLTYRVPSTEQAAPIIFIGDTYIQGEDEIISKLPGMIDSGYGYTTILPEDMAKTDIQKNSSETDYLSEYHSAGVFLTGLANGLNPCSLSMLLFFLSMIVAKNKSVLKLGFAFIVGKFISYIALGAVFFEVFSKIGGDWYYRVEFIIKILMLVVAVFLVIMYLRDYFAVKNEKYEQERMQLPAGLRKFNHRLIKRFAGVDNKFLVIFLAFGLGAIIAVGEFICTGQIYLATIIYMLKASETINIRAIIYFLIYGAAFVLPLIILTLVIYRGKEIFDISEIVRGKLHIIKLINALIFLAFALIVLFFF